MNIYRRHLSVGLLALAAGGISWVSASGEVVLYPATIAFTASWPADLVVASTSLQANPVLGGNAITKSVSGSQPLTLVVDGGNPDLQDNPGVSYRLYLTSYFQPTSSQSTYFQVSRTTPVNVRNTSSDRSVTVQTLFNPAIARPTVRVNLTGSSATLSSFSVYASASNSAVGESYTGYVGATPAAGALSGQGSLPAPARAGVQLYGTATVLVNGAARSYSLSSRIVDLSTSSDPPPWTIDINNDTTVTGDILVANLGAATPAYRVYYNGADSSTSGISGSVNVSTGSVPANYSFDIPHGSFQTYLRAVFSSPSRNFYTPRRTRTYQPGVNNDPFELTLGQGAVTMSLGGFYGLGDLYSASSELRGTSSGTANHSGHAAGTFLHTLPVGAWSTSSMTLRIRNVSDPLLPNDSSIERYYYTGQLSPPPVAATGIANLGTESFTLVKSTMYFDVVEPRAPGAPEPTPIKLWSPEIMATKYEPNPNGTNRRRTTVWAYGSSEQRALSGLTIVAEPGQYELQARAYVNNTLTRFSGTTITFGDLVPTPPSGSGQIPLSNTPDLQITLDVTGAGQGSAAFVETPLGPPPPAGFQMSCSAPPGEELPPELECPNTYYDINSTTTWETATICIRKKFARPQTEANAASEFLTLWRYVNDDWKELDNIVRTDCSGDPLACGCTSGDCGIPEDTFLFKVCGTYSPQDGFAAQLGTKSALAGGGHSALLLAGFKPIELTNVVGGVEHTGPTGPLQTWTVPGDGDYRITAVGAQGAAATAATGRQGGCGTEIAGDFALAEGDVIQILVGQAGTAVASSGGGGGGSFIVRNGVPLLVAGGGGGVRSGATVDGRPGSLTADGTAGSTSAAYTSGFVAGGIAGAGGARASSYGSGGGGWAGNGASDGTYGEGGFSFLGAKQAQGGQGKGCGLFAHGGFGGGGAGNGCYGGGGGGGYSGGGGGRVGGGGGSWNTGANPASRQPPTCEPHGRVTIELR